MPLIATQTILLPGDVVPSEDLPLPKSSSAALKLGPGLTHTPPSTISANVAGTLHADPKKHAIWIENNTGRYTPHPSDLVLATVQRSTAEAFSCTLAPHSPPALLPHLAFESASRKTRPQLASGALVYARVASSAAHMRFQDAELTCVNAGTGKADGLGELKGGMLFDVSLEMARRLLMAEGKGEAKGVKGGEGRVVVLETLAKAWPFEVAVGRNGRVWVEAGDVKRTLVVGRCLRETDEGGLGVEEQEKLVRRVKLSMGVE